MGNVCLQGGEAPETERAPGGGLNVLVEGVEKWGVKDSLESRKDLPSFSLGTWKSSRECRARGKSVLSFPADLTLSRLIRSKPRLMSLRQLVLWWMPLTSHPFARLPAEGRVCSACISYSTVLATLGLSVLLFACVTIRCWARWGQGLRFTHYSLMSIYLGDWHYMSTHCLFGK